MNFFLPEVNDSRCLLYGRRAVRSGSINDTDRHRAMFYSVLALVIHTA